MAVMPVLIMLLKQLFGMKNAMFIMPLLKKNKGIFALDTNFKVVKIIPFVYSKDNTLNPEEVYDLALDKKDRLWVCGSSLYVYDKASQKIVPANKIYPHLLLKNQRFQNMVIRNNDIFLQPSNFTSRAIYRITINTLALDSILLPDEIAKDKNYLYQPVKLIDYLVLDKEGRNAYMGYSKFSVLDYIDCLVQLNLETKKARRVKLIGGVEHNEFSNLFNYQLDDSGHIWFETEDGIMVYQPESLHLLNKIETGEELFSKQLYNITGAGIMCRLYSGGVILYDYKNNHQIHLTINDGLNSYSNSAIVYANKNLFVGASNYIQHMPLVSVIGKQNTARKCYLSSIQLFNHPYTTDTLPENLSILNMPHDKNFITLTFSSTEFEQPERLEYRYKMNGIDKDWVYVNSSNRTISYNDLNPGNYIFQAAVKNANGQWSNNDINLAVNIIPAWWQTNLCKILCAILIIAAVYWFIHWRIKSIRKQEQVKGRYEKELLELEAKALRAQMNPHFIFNCMNSIKSLIQKNDQEHAVLYLTTFSKLIRTVFQNSDKREITLYDEIETSRLYTQLESMRFGNKFSYTFNIDKTLDLKSVMVPALIVQPFIENAIWHGIMPKEDGGTVNVNVDKTEHSIRCIIDDDGIGREMSRQNKFQMETSIHESKGEHLTQARLDLDNLLNERSAKVEIIDKKDSNGKSCGTTVILNFNLYSFK
jgi:anti-sigma regulatory factor (Ser/Thr protein kinase)